MATKKKMLQAAAGSAAGGGFTAIEDVFSTYLYTGNSSTQTITNGIDLAGEGGLVWMKLRSQPSPHALYDTARGALKELATDSASAEFSETGLTSFNSDGFVLGSRFTTNNLNDTFASWTFRKAPRFFDVVTYTGTGSPQTIAHNLGTTVGTLIIKTTDAGDLWRVYHRSTGNQYVLALSETLAQIGPDAVHWNNTDPTDSHFTVGVNGSLSGRTYVAYLFAHDPLGPSGDGSDGLIACGSLASGNDTIDLGWEPQWVMIKRTDADGNWLLLDNMRGIATGGDDKILLPNINIAEITIDLADLNATGFTGKLGIGTYIYIAIRRGPMRAPESGTEVFKPLSALVTSNPQSFVTGFPADFIWSRRQNATSEQPGFVPKLTRRALYPNSTSAEVDASDPSGSFVAFDSNDRVTTGGYYSAGFGSVQSLVAFRRAPEFFDVVAYTGNGVAGRTVPHNLGVAPELIIVKNRSSNIVWVIQANIGAVESYGFFDSGAFFSGSNYAGITAEHIELLSNTSSNGSGSNYIMYLFSTLAGISKVGSYTGNGSSQTINCGFTTGARFILIKRTDGTGDWYVWDTARGIVTGNDPFLELNTTDAEVTSDDSIDPDSSGFIVNQTATTNVNVNAASYIFYAIA